MYLVISFNSPSNNLLLVLCFQNFFTQFGPIFVIRACVFFCGFCHFKKILSFSLVSRETSTSHLQAKSLGSITDGDLVFDLDIHSEPCWRKKGSLQAQGPGRTGPLGRRAPTCTEWGGVVGVNRQSSSALENLLGSLAPGSFYFPGWELLGMSSFALRWLSDILTDPICLFKVPL